MEKSVKNVPYRPEQAPNAKFSRHAVKQSSQRGPVNYMSGDICRTKYDGVNYLSGKLGVDGASKGGGSETQKKGVGLTGKGNGHGANGFTPKGLTAMGSPVKSGTQRKGRGGQVKG